MSRARIRPPNLSYQKATARCGRVNTRADVAPRDDSESGGGRPTPRATPARAPLCCCLLFMLCPCSAAACSLFALSVRCQTRTPSLASLAAPPVSSRSDACAYGWRARTCAQMLQMDCFLGTWPSSRSEPVAPKQEKQAGMLNESLSMCVDTAALQYSAQPATPQYSARPADQGTWFAAFAPSRRQTRRWAESPPQFRACAPENSRKRIDLTHPHSAGSRRAVESVALHWSFFPTSHGMAWEVFEPRPPAREGQQKTRL